MRLAAQVLLSIIGGFFLMYPLGLLFGAMNWPTFHSWGLTHGSLFSAWPTLSLVSFALLSLAPWFRPMQDAPLLAAAALVGLGLTAVLVGNPGPAFHAPLYLLAITAACSATLCYFASRPWLVALVVALPMVFFDLQFLMMPFDAVRGYLNFHFLRVTTPVIAAASLGLGLAYVARRARARLPGRDQRPT